MLVSRPSYYDRFRCLASACPDSCCQQWSVQVDERAEAYYRGLPGPLGEKLRSVLTQEDGETVFAVENGRCPLWRADGLCRIQAELGEQALCDVCRDFPRIRHDFGDFAELQLELSCPEAARLILLSPPEPALIHTEPDTDPPEYDRTEMELLKAQRKKLLNVLCDPTLTPAQALLAFYQEASGEEITPEGPGDIRAVADFFASLEILTPQWPLLLAKAAALPVHPLTRSLARYLTERYWLRRDLGDDWGKGGFIVSCCLLVSALGEEFPENAQLFSKEVENCAENMDALMDAVYDHPAFSPENLTALLHRS